MHRKYNWQYYLDRDAAKKEKHVSEIKICDRCGALYQFKANSRAGTYPALFQGTICHHCAKERESMVQPQSDLSGQMKSIINRINALIDDMRQPR